MDKIVFIDRDGRTTTFDKDGSEMMWLINRGVILLSQYIEWLIADGDIIVRIKIRYGKETTSAKVYRGLGE